MCAIPAVFLVCFILRRLAPGIYLPTHGPLRMPVVRVCLGIQVAHMEGVGVPLSGRVCLLCAVEGRQFCVLGRAGWVAAFCTAL